MKIIFMGTPDFAVKSLSALIDAKHDIIAVFTKADSKSGRGQKLKASPVKELAVLHNIKVFEPKTLKIAEQADLIKSLNPDCIVVAAYGKILPSEILSIPKYGCVNVHGSILPKYRGAAPIQWCVLNGETETGITTMLMNDGIDTGDILLQEKTKIGENETAFELFSRLASIGASLLIKTISALEKGECTPIKQDDNEATYVKILSKEMCPTDFSQNAQIVHNHIRGLSQSPCATAYLDGKRLKIYKSEVVDFALFASHDEATPGEIISRKDFIVACGENTAIKLTEVLYDGSKKMDGGAFLRGRHLINNTILTNNIEKEGIL